jgi:hypothetical protein
LGLAAAVYGNSDQVEKNVAKKGDAMLRQSVLERWQTPVSFSWKLHMILLRKAGGGSVALFTLHYQLMPGRR